jgi:hypothetical protein
MGVLLASMLFATAGAVSACGPADGEAKAEPTAVVEPASAAPTTTKPAPTTTAKPVPTFDKEIADAAFTTVTLSLDPFSSAADRISLGHTICEGLDLGLSPTTIGVELMSTFTAEQAWGWLGASAAAYCPAYSDAVESGSGN